LNCAFVHSRIHDFISGELGEEDRIRFENHLQECSSCRSCVDNMSMLRTRVHNLMRSSAPQHLRDRLVVHKKA